MRIYFVLLFLFAHFSYAQVVKVMTYNVRYDTPSDSVNQWGRRADKVYALVKKYDPDIVGIQEALHSQVIDLVTNLPAYSFVGVGRDDGKTKGEYSAILYKKSKFSVLRQNTFWLSETPEVVASKNWDAAITRVATWAAMRDINSGKELFILNTHFDHIGKEARTRSALIIKDKLESLAAGLPAIVMGDLNCTRQDPPFATLTKKQGMILIDPVSGNPPGTFCSFKVNSIECRAIDYILHNDDWTSDGYIVITDNDGKYYPSDHLPVMVKLSVAYSKK
ncbi:MAG: endonuclease/exonuclease/phosphatase family protein [Chryseolinea sp.]